MSLFLTGAILTSSIIYAGIPVNALTEEQPQQIFYEAIDYANARLKKKNAVAVFKNQLPEEPLTPWIDANRNLLLGVQIHGREEPIDIIYLKTLDGNCIKTSQILGYEIIQKVEQHLLAKTIKEILISESGSKFDTRALTKNKISIDLEGYIRVNDHRLVVLTSQGAVEIQAKQLRSYTILRFIEENGIIRIFDDFDLLRQDNRGMYLDPEKLHDKFIVIQRDELTAKTKEHLAEVLKTIPSP